MADISEVLVAVRDAVAHALDQAALVQPGPSWRGTRIYVGWPGADLDKDLGQGIAHVTVWPRGNATILAPYMQGWRDSGPVVPSLAAAMTGETVSFTGTGTVPQQIAAVVVDHVAAYTYALVPGDGPAQVAQHLAALIAVDRTASATGGAVTVPGAISLEARVVAGGSEQRETRRVAHSIQITAWSATPTGRDALIRAIDAVVDEGMRALPLPDGSLARLSYQGTVFDEDARQQPLHRRDLLVTAEFAASQSRAVPAIAVPVLIVTPEPARISRTVLS